MKDLTSLTKDQLSELWDSTGSFFAFSNTQLEENRVEGVEYVRLISGLIVPKDKAKYVMAEMERIHDEGVSRDIELHGMDAIVKRELYNYECFYVGDITEAVEALESYPVGYDYVYKIYRQELPNVDF